MTEPRGSAIGTVGAIWRYPVKSMVGEALETAEVGRDGVAGDRSFALFDPETGKIVSAKNPRRWSGLFQCRSTLVAAADGTAARARITLPDGQVVETNQDDIEARLSTVFGRPVKLATSALSGATAEGYWPEHEWLPEPGSEFVYELPSGTFFDGARLHLLTSASLARLRALAPGSDFAPARFRANFLIQLPDEAEGFVEDGWLGRTLTLGDVELRIERPTPRCVMTTLAQPDLPKDPAILRTAVQANQSNVGVYASVLKPGTVRRGDPVNLL
ncbi:MAG: MOSC domain-containing protein [Isosphaeraceae bacterium]